MKQPFFTGACTALVTPFLGGKVNYPMMEQLLRRQIDAGIEAVVICGTTGESATLSDCEKLELFRRAKAYVGDSCLIIAGTGSNCTEHAAALSRAAEGAGADALLVVTPYYNKATPEGLLAHYSAVTGAVHIPVIAYNVPSRTGVDIPVEVYGRLSRIPNLAGVKEASSSISKIGKLCAACPDFPVWSGNDDQAVAVMSLGGQGVISVLSNVAPVETQAMAQAALAGDFDTAAALQAELLPLIELLFCEVNPIPVKKAMELLHVFELDDKADFLASNLPYGDQRKLEIARTLATEPKLLLLDEPAAGMNPNETVELMNTIRFVRDNFDMTVLLIEHDMTLVSGICEKLSVLNFGQLLCQGNTSDVLNNPEVITAYLGE